MKLYYFYTSKHSGMARVKLSCIKGCSVLKNSTRDKGLLPSRAIKFEDPSDIELLTIEITIRKNRILVAGIYKPPNLNEIDLTTSIETIISKVSNSYEKLILIGDFNVTTNNPILSILLDSFAL